MIVSRLSLFLSKAAKGLALLGMVAMTLIIGWQVFARYGLNASPSWTEQAALYLMLWFIFFAAAAGVREGFHIRITVLEQVIEPDRAKAIRIFCHLVVMAFGLAMLVSGAGLVAATWEHSIPTIGLPRGSAYIPFVGAGAMIVFFSFEHILAELKGEAVKKSWN